MPRIEALPRETLGDLGTLLATAESRMGFVPNSQLIMARRPEILRAFAQLGAAINGPSSTIDPQLRTSFRKWRAAPPVAAIAWRTRRVGVSAAKETALWEYETRPLFSDAERARLIDGDLELVVYALPGERNRMSGPTWCPCFASRGAMARTVSPNPMCSPPSRAGEI